jgi:predicted RNA methylase
VTRTNPKTVTLDRRSYPRTLPYEQIRTVECPHDGTETKITIPRKAKAGPAGGNGTAERLSELKERGQDAKAGPLYVDARTEYFPTPPAVVEQMAEAAGLEPGMTVLEPSAGLGAIASAIEPLVTGKPGGAVTCIERDYNLWQRLTANERYRSVQHGDFLEADPSDGPLYDRVMMNPPFSGQADVRHVTHALGFVKPGGLVVAIMSAGVGFRQDKTAETFRKLVADHGGRIERLPDDAFEGSGVNVRTVLVTIPAG